MQRLIYKGNIVAEHPTRAMCIVEAFERRLVYDYGKKRNSLLPGVKIEGEDDVDHECEGDRLSDKIRKLVRNKPASPDPH